MVVYGICRVCCGLGTEAQRAIGNCFGFDRDDMLYVCAMLPFVRAMGLSLDLD